MRALLPHTRAQGAQAARGFRAVFYAGPGGDILAPHEGVIWFFEKDTDLLVCEIRRTGDDDSGYEFEIASAAGPKTTRFASPTELISTYLAEQARLIKDGWRPRADLQVVD